MKDITTDLYDRLALLRIRYTVVFGVTDHHLGVRDLAQGLADGLRAYDPKIVARVRGVIDPRDLDDVDRAASFWSTSLGRLLFAAGGFSGVAVSQSFAAGVLGCSRQWVHALVTSGQVRSETGINPAARQVHAGDVRELLKAKIDDLVK